MIYHCKIWKEKNASNEDIYIAQFPDMPNIATCGFSHEEALAMAKDALGTCLETDVSQGYEIPPPAFTEGYPVIIENHIVLSPASETSDKVTPDRELIADFEPVIV